MEPFLLRTSALPLCFIKPFVSERGQFVWIHTMFLWCKIQELMVLVEVFSFFNIYASSLTFSTFFHFQGFILFALFGLDSQLIVVPFVKRWVVYSVVWVLDRWWHKDRLHAVVVGSVPETVIKVVQWHLEHYTKIPRLHFMKPSWCYMLEASVINVVATVLAAEVVWWTWH